VPEEAAPAAVAGEQYWEPPAAGHSIVVGLRRMTRHLVGIPIYLTFLRRYQYEWVVRTHLDDLDLEEVAGLRAGG